MNNIPKYVVSRTLKRAGLEQHDGHLGRRRGPGREAKAQPGGEILVYGSPDLVDELLRHDLVDEYRLLVFPVILGGGKRMFRDRIDTRYLRLVESRDVRVGRRAAHATSRTPRSRRARTSRIPWTPEQLRTLRAAEDIDRVLATVLFTDIVDSTGRAAELGDRAGGNSSTDTTGRRGRDRALARAEHRVRRATA